MTIKSLIKSAIYPLYEKRLLNRLDLTKTPRHIGVILDAIGDGRKRILLQLATLHRAGAISPGPRRLLNFSIGAKRLRLR